MPRSLSRSLAIAVPCLCTLATLVASPTAQATTPLTEVGFVVNVGAAIQPFVRNYGQDVEQVKFAARSFGGTVFVLDDAISVALAADATSPRATLTARFAGNSSLVVEAGPTHGALANFYLGDDPNTWLEDMLTYASIDLLGVSSGIDVSVDASGRDLRWSITSTTPSKLDDLIWSYDDAKSLEIAADGSLLVGLQAYDAAGEEIAEEVRVVRIARPRAWQGINQVPITAEFVLDGSDVRVEVSGALTKAPVLVEVMTRYSEVRHGQDTQLAGASVWAQGSSDPFIAGSKSDATIDMLGVRYNAAGTKIDTITVVGGDGNTTGHGLGLSLEGHIWMSGTTVADDFPTEFALQSTRAGGSDAVIVELDEDGHLLSSSYYGGEGDDEGEDVEVDGDGVLWLAGKAELPIPGPEFEPGDGFGTSFSDGVGHHGDFFVAAIDTDTLDVRGTTCFGGYTSNGDVVVNIDDDDKVWVGQPSQPASSTFVDFDYQQNAPHTGCDRISEAWGFEALCWKYNIASQSTPGLSYYPNNISLPLALTEIVTVTTYTVLNSLEANPSLFTLDPGGVWEGPWYGTPSDINTASSGAEVAVAAALYMHRWGSPVYANGITPVTVNPIYPDAMGLHRVIFRGVDASDDPAQACTGFVNSSDPGWEAHPIYQVAENCAFNTRFSVNNIEYSHWNHNVNPTGYDPSRWTGATTSWFVPPSGNSYHAVYVGDPPEEEAFMVAHIDEYAAVVAPSVRENMMIVRRWYDAGVVVDEDEAVELAPRSF